MASITDQRSTHFTVSRSQRLTMFFWIFIVVIGMPTASSITCYCEGSYCNNDGQISTCEARARGYCFSAVEEVWDEAREKLELNYSFGCLPPGIQGYMQCKGYMLPHYKVNSIYCCREDICNKEAILVPKIESTVAPVPTTVSTPVPTLVPVPVTTPETAPVPVPVPEPDFFKDNALIILVALVIIFWAMATSLFVFAYFFYGLKIHKCLMFGAGSTDLDDDSIVSKPPILLLGSKGKPVTLPYVHIESDAKTRY